MMTEPNNTQNQPAPQIAALQRRSWPVGERERRLLPPLLKRNSTRMAPGTAGASWMLARQVGRAPSMARIRTAA